MEVHHAHHPTHKKKWSEYIIEFVMLFAAVTLGFFAENIREHQVLVERKNQNLEGIVQDLKKDSIKLGERINEYLIAMENLEDQKFASFQYEKKQLSESNYLDYIIQKNDTLVVGLSFFINNSAYKNTIASGSLSVINSFKIKQLITEYYEELGIRLLDNNRNLDDQKNEWLKKTINSGTYGMKTEYKKRITKIPIQYHLDEIKNNHSFRKAVLDPDFRTDTERFEHECEFYLYLLIRFKNLNNKFLLELEKKQF